MADRPEPQQMPEVSSGYTLVTVSSFQT